MIKFIFLIVFIVMSIACTCFAWDGYDYSNGTFVEIESGNLVRSGNEIEVFDYSTGQYHDVTVDSIERYGSTVEVEVYDYSTGEYRTLEMDD